MKSASTWLMVAVISACGDDGDAPAIDATPPGVDAGAPDATPLPPEDFSRDIVSTDLALDVTAHTGTAVIEIAPSTTSTSASFEVGGLTINSVTGPAGALAYGVTDGRLDVAVPTGSSGPITVDYAFQVQPDFNGWMGSVSLIWPYYCGNLFPCKSAPDDGLTFGLSVTGVPAGQTAVFPATIDADAPSYMIAVAVGDYTEVSLGTTTAGTQVSVWHLPGGGPTAMTGAANLRDIFDWLETTYGAYSFGPKAGSVSVVWGPGAYGGMEHHPYWHIASVAMADEETHAHEAAHGWFGDGIRMRCWEDFVLSEGTVSYLAARAINDVVGAAAGDAVWMDYQARLDNAVANEDIIAWPDGCNQIDILADGLFSTIPYMKGAFFYRALEQQVGAPALDAALRAFYAAHVGGAATMQDMLDTIQAETGFDPTTLAQGWLKSLGTP